MTVARLFEIVLGLVFLAGAALKATDIPGFALGIRQYQILFDPQLLQMTAGITVVVETILGGALLAGIRLRGLVHGAAAALLVVFSGMIAYAWAAHGLEDCACFGSSIKMGPGRSLVKNAVMIAMLAIAWAFSRRRERVMPWTLRSPIGRVAAVIAAGVVVAAAAAVGVMEEGSVTRVSNPPASAAGARDTSAGPFVGVEVEDAGLRLNLSEGIYLAAIMSATCDHCKDSVRALNDLAGAPGFPQIVGLMMGEPAELDEFRSQTGPAFPTQRVDTMLWIRLLGDADAPPRFVLVKNGEPVAHWDDEVPEADAVIMSASGETRAGDAMS